MDKYETGTIYFFVHSKHINKLKEVVFDYVVTVCDQAHERCPYFPGKAKIVHIGFDDPPKLASEARNEDQALVHYRRVRDGMKDFVERLPQVLSRDQQTKRT